MRSKFFAVLGIVGTLTFAGCSSSEADKPPANSGSPSNGAVAVSPDSANVNASVANGMVVPPQAIDANTSNAAPSDELAATLPPQFQNRLDKLQKSGAASGPPVDARALAMKNAMPAPDNSTFTSYLSDAGYEIRTFKTHPQLQRVEKKVNNEGKASIKVYLRDGRVIDVPEQSIPSLATAPAALIISAAGLSPAPGRSAPSSTGAKSN